MGNIHAAKICLGTLCHNCNLVCKCDTNQSIPYGKFCNNFKWLDHVIDAFKILINKRVDMHDLLLTFEENLGRDEYNKYCSESLKISPEEYKILYEAMVRPWELNYEVPPRKIEVK